MMLGLTAYVAYHAKTRYGTYWHRWGPTYLTIMAGILVMADLTRHVVEDLGWWSPYQDNGWGAEEYREGCPTEDMGCLSPVGWLFTIVATYTGFTLLVIGTLWNANICDKLKDLRAEWRRLRKKSTT